MKNTWYNRIDKIMTISTAVICYLFTDYTQNSAVLNDMNWTALIISVIVAGFFYLYNYLANRRKYAIVLEKLKADFDEVVKQHKEHIDDYYYEKEHDRNAINNVVIYNVLKAHSKNFEDKTETAETLISFSKDDNIRCEEWKEFGIPIDIVNEMKKIYNSRQIDKLTKENIEIERIAKFKEELKNTELPF